MPYAGPASSASKPARRLLRRPGNRQSAHRRQPCSPARLRPPMAAGNAYRLYQLHPPSGAPRLCPAARPPSSARRWWLQTAAGLRHQPGRLLRRSASPPAGKNRPSGLRQPGSPAPRQTKSPAVGRASLSSTAELLSLPNCQQGAQSVQPTIRQRRRGVDHNRDDQSGQGGPANHARPPGLRTPRLAGRTLARSRYRSPPRCKCRRADER
jgi:hypothetical protein